MPGAASVLCLTPCESGLLTQALNRNLLLFQTDVRQRFKLCVVCICTFHFCPHVTYDFFLCEWCPHSVTQIKHLSGSRLLCATPFHHLISHQVWFVLPFYLFSVAKSYQTSKFSILWLSLSQPDSGALYFAPHSTS